MIKVYCKVGVVAYIRRLLGVIVFILCVNSAYADVVFDDVLVTGDKPDNPEENYKVKKSKSALKLELDVKETPQNVSTTTQKQIKDFALHDANEALAYSSNINVERVETDRTAYSSRGFDVLNFQMDGVPKPLSSGLLRGSLDSALYERVDVLSGANGITSLFGDPSASINFVRKRPKFTPSFNATTTVGAWNFRRVDVDYTNAVSDFSAVRLIGVVQNEESYLDRYARDKQMLSASMTYEIGDNGDLTVGMSAERTNAKSPMWGGIPLVYADGSPTNYLRGTSTSPDWSSALNQDITAYSNYLYALESGWDINIDASLSVAETDSKLLFVNGSEDIATGDGLISQIISRYQADTQLGSVDVYASGEWMLLPLENQMIVGVQHSITKIDDASTSPTAGFDANFPSLWEWNGHLPEPIFDGNPTQSTKEETQSSVYGAAKINITDKTLVVLGARVLSAESTVQRVDSKQTLKSSAKTSPYVGLVYDINDKTTLYASHSVLFKPQALDAVGANNEVLSPIQGESSEVGIKQNVLGRNDLVTLSLFKAHQSNLPEFAGISAQTNRAFYRAADLIESQGVELNYAGSIQDQFKLNVSGSYIEMTDEEGKSRREFTPRSLFRASALYHKKECQMCTVGVSYRWQSDTKAPAFNYTQEAYGVVDLTASYSLTDKMAIRANLKNVFDRKYYKSLAWGESHFAQGRSLYFSFDVKN